jgi:hypothetical protein
VFNAGAGVSGVASMIVELNGSGGIDNVVFDPEEFGVCKPCLDFTAECISPSDPTGVFTIQGTVTNCGDVDLKRVFVGNSKAGVLLILVEGLAPGDSTPFFGTYPADVGPGECSTSLTRVLAFPPKSCDLPALGETIASTCCLSIGEGCTPGYWKTHGEHWDQDPGDPIAEAAGFTAGTLFHDFFDVTPAQSNLPAGITMIDAASAEITGGGPKHALAWHGIAGLLNLAAGLGYELPPGINDAGELKVALEQAWISGDTELLKAQLSANNEAGCPLGN